MNGIRLVARGVALMAVVGCTGAAEAQVELPPLVNDHMVIQRDAEVPLHGQAPAGTMVRVEFDGDTRSARADTDGRWRVRLPPRPAGGPHDIVISAGADTVVVRDILVGDVWIASGQSNMEWPVADALNAEAEIAAADDPAIRNFRVPQSWSYTPARQLVGGEWEVSDSVNVGAHSAVAYFFARQLREHVGVPIGIIDNSWG
ncbi:MAG: 9-O-acetylesterase, partial [Gemmatimonadota bacterium]